MSSSDHESHSETPEMEVPAPKTIPVYFGTVRATGVLVTASRPSVMTHKLFSKIRNKCSSSKDGNVILEEYPCKNSYILDGCGGKAKILKNVVLEARIEGFAVKLPVLVVAEFALHLILGTDFMYEVKASFDFNFDCLKWFCGEEAKASSFINSLECPSCCICENWEDDGCEKKCVTEAASNLGITLGLTSPTKLPPKPHHHKHKPTEELEYAEPVTKTVYVYMKQLVEVTAQHPSIGYFGVWWRKDHVDNIFHTEVMEKISIIGFTLKAISAAIEKSVTKGIKRLLVVINRDEGLELVRAFMRDKKMKSSKQVKYCKLSDYVVYKKLCPLLSSMEEVQLQYTPDTGDIPREMRRLRKAIYRMVDVKEVLRNH